MSSKTQSWKSLSFDFSAILVMLFDVLVVQLVVYHHSNPENVSLFPQCPMFKSIITKAWLKLPCNFHAFNFAILSFSFFQQHRRVFSWQSLSPFLSFYKSRKAKNIPLTWLIDTHSVDFRMSCCALQAVEVKAKPFEYMISILFNAGKTKSRTCVGQLFASTNLQHDFDVLLYCKPKKNRI